MSQQPKKTRLPKHLRLPTLILTIAIISLLLSIGIHSLPLYNNPSDQPDLGSSSPIITNGTQINTNNPGNLPANNGSVSPLIFGTNLSLFDSNDQVLTSASTRSQLQQMHFRIIRMPVRPSLSNNTEIQAAQAIKSIGAYALVVLRGAVDTNVLADDTRLVNDMNSVFGNTPVFYEYGNEEDLLGVNVTRYTASWNSIISQLKRIAHNAHFIGPVNYQYDRTYLTTFLQHANPRPDEVSWHEYTCDDAWPNDTCISRLANWTSHINDARGAMTQTIRTALPIMITEWNYAPNAHPNDGKINNSSFMSTWTTQALETLAANRVFASMQYACTNSIYAVVTKDGTPTAQGLAIKNTYQRMIITGQQPTPVSTTTSSQVQPPSTATIVPNQHIAFSFEDGGIDGWSGYGKEVSLEQNSTDNALDGTYALRVTLTNLSNSSTPYLLSSTLTTSPHPGQIIDAYIYLPDNSVSLTARVFVVDSHSRWLSNSMTKLTPGSWNHLTYTLPASASGQIRQIGIQFNTSTSTPISTDIYIDAVGWH